MPQPSKGLDGLVSQAKVSRRFHLAAIKLLGRRSHVVKRVLCDGEGQVTPDAELMMAILAQEARLSRHGFQSDAERRLFDAGAQHIVRLMMDLAEMDSSRLARIEQKLHDELKG